LGSTTGRSSLEYTCREERIVGIERIVGDREDSGG